MTDTKDLIVKEKALEGEVVEEHITWKRVGAIDITMKPTLSQKLEAIDALISMGVLPGQTALDAEFTKLDKKEIEFKDED